MFQLRFVTDPDIVEEDDSLNTINILCSESLLGKELSRWWQRRIDHRESFQTNEKAQIERGVQKEILWDSQTSSRMEETRYITHFGYGEMTKLDRMAKRPRILWDKVGILE